MRIVYRDKAGLDRSRLAAAIVEIHRWLPSRVSEFVSWRLHSTIQRATQTSFKWAERVQLEGPGPLEMRGDTRIGADTLIAVKGERAALSIGDAVFIDRQSTLLCYGDVRIGNHVYIGTASYIDGRGGVTIGNRTQIGPGAKIVSFNHAPEHGGPDTMEGITIGDGVWLGANVVILDGASIGDRAVVAAGAVVRGHVAPETLVGGVPAKFIRTIGSKTESPRSTPSHASMLQVLRRDGNDVDGTK